MSRPLLLILLFLLGPSRPGLTPAPRDRSLDRADAALQRLQRACGQDTANTASARGDDGLVLVEGDDVVVGVGVAFEEGEVFGGDLVGGGDWRALCDVHLELGCLCFCGGWEGVAVDRFVVGGGADLDGWMDGCIVSWGNGRFLRVERVLACEFWTG